MGCVQRRCVVVSNENTTMIAMCRELGFDIACDASGQAPPDKIRRRNNAPKSISDIGSWPPAERV
jgi:phosphoribosylaminoimidazole (AIR) synthetase